MSVYDVLTVGFLVFLEGALSFDNAAVLAIMVRHLPSDQRKKALTYGIAGAIGFRFAALFVLTKLLNLFYLKVLGGAYLIYLAIKHFTSPEEEEKGLSKAHDFWRTVVMIELMDIAFSVDSIAASVAVSRDLWVVFTGGALGIVMMRFAATVFVKLLDRYPRIEPAVYLLIGGLGAKMVFWG